MKFNFIVATISNREDLIDPLIDSIVKSEVDYNILIINQADIIYEKYNSQNYDGKIDVNYLNTRGLSYARNIGLDDIDGGIIAFSDDDCYYGSGALKSVINFFEDNGHVDVLLGRQVDPKNGKSAAGQRKDSFFVTEKDLSHVGNSICIFVRLSKSTQKQRFDCNMGAGRYFGSHEERDYLASLLSQGVKIFYNGEIEIYHRVYDFSDWPGDKAISYARGMGAYFRRHHGFSFVSFYWLILRPFVGVLLSMFELNSHKFKYRARRIFGNVMGFMAFK